MHRKFRALLALVVFAALASAVYGADLKLYVKNRPFEGPTATRSGQLHAALDAVLQALGYSWRLTGERVDVTRKAGGGPSLPAGNLQVFLEGNPVTLPIVDVQGRAFVNLAVLARAMNLYYNPSPALGTADLSVPVARDQVGGAWGRDGGKTPAPAGEATPATGGTETPAAGSGTGKGKQEMIETDGTNRKSPIQVLRTDFSDSTTPGANFTGEVRVSTAIKNKSDETLEKVTLFLRLLNLAGDTVQEWRLDIGTMKPGAEVSFTPEPPIWYNYNKIQVQPQVIVKHLSIPEPEEEPTEPKPEGGK